MKVATKIVACALVVFAVVSSAFANDYLGADGLFGNFYSATCDPHVGGGSSQSFITFFDFGYFLRVNVFFDNNCQTLAMKIDQNGYANTNVPAPTTTVPGAFSINFGITSRTLTPVTAAAVDFLNATCSSNFTAFDGNFHRHREDFINRPVFANELTCPAMGFVPVSQCPTEYQIGMMSGGSLSLGAGNLPDHCTPATRATAINAAAVLTRIEPLNYPEILGEYTLPCTQIVSSPTEPISIMVKVYATQLYFTTDVEVYGGNGGCAPNNFLETIITSGSYRVFGPVAAGSNVYAAEFAPESKARYLSQTVADQLTARCPLYTWPANSFIDVSFRNCTAAGLIPNFECPVIYDSVSLTSAGLNYGSFNPASGATNFCTYSSRPATLSTLPIPQSIGALTIRRDFIIAVVIAAVVAFFIGALIFGIVCCLCCRNRNSSSGNDSQYSQYKSPLTGQ
jgi:hypothetical protein